MLCVEKIAPGRSAVCVEKIAHHPHGRRGLLFHQPVARVGHDRFGHVRGGGKRLLAQLLATSRRILVASPGYLACNPKPRTPADLEAHRGIVYANRNADWRFTGPSGWTVSRPRAALRVNNGLIMRDAAVAGLGITLLPAFFVDAALSTGALVQVDAGVEAEGAEVSIAYPRDRSPSAKIAALTESLKLSFGDPPYWKSALAGS